MKCDISMLKQITTIFIQLFFNFMFLVFRCLSQLYFVQAIDVTYNMWRQWCKHTQINITIKTNVMLRQYSFITVLHHRMAFWRHIHWAIMFTLNMGRERGIRESQEFWEWGSFLENFLWENREYSSFPEKILGNPGLRLYPQGFLEWAILFPGTWESPQGLPNVQKTVHWVLMKSLEIRDLCFEIRYQDSSKM